MYASRSSSAIHPAPPSIPFRRTGERLGERRLRTGCSRGGGGHAQLTPALVDAEHEVVVLGSAPECGARVAPWVGEGRCRFDVGSLLALPYPDCAFDVALSFRLLAHISAPERLIGQLCRVAERAVVVDYPSTWSVNVVSDRLFALKRKVEHNTRRFTLFRPEQIASAFAKHDSAVTAAAPQFLFPMALHRLLGSAGTAAGDYRRVGVAGDRASGPGGRNGQERVTGLTRSGPAPVRAAGRPRPGGLPIPGWSRRPLRPDRSG